VVGAGVMPGPVWPPEVNRPCPGLVGVTSTEVGPGVAGGGDRVLCAADRGSHDPGTGLQSVPNVSQRSQSRVAVALGKVQTPDEAASSDLGAGSHTGADGGSAEIVGAPVTVALSTGPAATRTVRG
jgi:hypothetical protein